MLLKLLDALEKNVIRHECAIYDILCDYNDEETGKKCEHDCNECKKASLEQIIKLKEETNEQKVEYINLDGLYLLKDKLIEKHNVLFNRFEVTESECGELNAITQTLYLIDDIMGKQATSDKTSYIEEQMRELSRKPLHDAETIARALEKVNNQSDKVNHPSHYNVHKHECIDEMIAVFGVEDVKAFCRLNAWKYRYRLGAKDGEEKEKDLAKADWHIEKLMELGQKGETK